MEVTQFSFPLCFFLLIVWHDSTQSYSIKNLIQLCSNLKGDRICDQNKFLKNHELERLIEEVKFVSTNTTFEPDTGNCPYKTGYDIFIVLDGRIDTQSGKQHLLSEARSRATTLLDQLVTTACGNALLIYYAIEDNMWYAVTNELVGKKLPSSLIGDIGLMNRKKFHVSHTEGLMGLIHDFRMVFHGQYKLKYYYREPEAARQRMSAKSDGNSRGLLNYPVILTSTYMLVRIYWLK